MTDVLPENVTATEPAPPPAPPKLTHEQLLEQMVQRLGVLSFNLEKSKEDYAKDVEAKRMARDDLRAAIDAAELNQAKFLLQTKAEMDDLRSRIKAVAEANAQVGG